MPAERLSNRLDSEPLPGLSAALRDIIEVTPIITTLGDAYFTNQAPSSASGTSRRPITGKLVAVDTFFTGTLKGVGWVYLQIVLGCRRPIRLGAAVQQQAALDGGPDPQQRCATVLREHRTKIATVLSDNGREFRGRPDRHPYELFQQLEEIEHRTTKVRRPHSNGFIERFHRTLP